jgi:hypothetical protein
MNEEEDRDYEPPEEPNYADDNIWYPLIVKNIA